MDEVSRPRSPFSRHHFHFVRDPPAGVVDPAAAPSYPSSVTSAYERWRMEGEGPYREMLAPKPTPPHCKTCGNMDTRSEGAARITRGKVLWECRSCGLARRATMPTFADPVTWTWAAAILCPLVMAVAVGHALVMRQPVIHKITTKPPACVVVQP